MLSYSNNIFFIKSNLSNPEQQSTFNYGISLIYSRSAPTPPWNSTRHIKASLKSDLQTDDLTSYEEETNLVIKPNQFTFIPPRHGWTKES